MGCLRGSTKRTRITIDIGVASTLPSPSYELSFYSFSISIFRVSLISPWSNGNILLLIGSLHSTRQISRSLSSCLFTSPFFISSNPSIDGKLISLLLRVSSTPLPLSLPLFTSSFTSLTFPFTVF